MHILILGGDGMLGHQLVESLAGRHTISTTVRSSNGTNRGPGEDRAEAVHYGVDAREFSKVQQVIEATRPDVVVNAIGIVKQRPDAKDEALSMEINAHLPHRLASVCRAIGARLIHVSTDCVFSGQKGMYLESDTADASDVYGRSKLLGEVDSEGCLTLRTSIIGLELTRKSSLIEWFLAQSGEISGFRRAIYSGFTTLEFARIIDHVITEHPERHGLYHVSSEPIDKYTLLSGLRDRLGLDLTITPDDEFCCDRSLDSSRFRRDFGYVPPSWDVMLDELSDQIKEKRL